MRANMGWSKALVAAGAFALWSAGAAWATDYSYTDFSNQNLTLGAGDTLTVGSGAANYMYISVGTTTSPAYIVDAALAATVNVNVGNLFVGVRTDTTTGSDQVVAPDGTLKLGAVNNITASAKILIGSEGRINTSDLTTAVNSTTVINTPDMRIGAVIRGGGTFVTGNGSTLTVKGIGDTGRTALIVGEERYASGGINWGAVGTMNLSGGQATLKLSSLVVGRSLFASSEANSGAGTLTMSSNTSNQLDISGTGSVVQVGVSAGNVATGTLTIGNLGSNSTITTTGSSTAILVGNRTTATGDAVSGTLNLNGGTVTITTSGAAIAGGVNATSNLNLSGGVTLKAGAASSDWIKSLDTAAIGSGGATIDTNGHNVGISQGFSGAGKLVKDGAGILTLDGANTYTGGTDVLAGTLNVTGSLSATGGLVVQTGASVTGTGTINSSLTFDAGAKLDLTDATIGAASTGILTVAGTQSISLTNFTFANITGWDWLNAADGTYTLINGGAATFAGTTSTIDNPYIDGTRSAYFEAGSLKAVISTIPEPGTLSMIGVIGIAMLLRRRIVK